MNQPLISLIVPCYNEAVNLELFHGALKPVLAGLPYEFEILVVDDGSSDDTLKVARLIESRDDRIKIIELVRNFGKEIAVSAGLHEAAGEAAIIIDADMQHPVEMLPKFLERWEDGAEVVVGLRLATRHHASWLRRYLAKWFYRILNRISYTAVTANATDYRLLDRLVINEFNRFTEHNRLTRGLIDWLGFRRSYVSFRPGKRANGDGYSYTKLIGLAIQSLVSLSLFPLRIAGYLGLLIMFVTLPVGIFVFFEKYVFNDPWGLAVTGNATLGLIILFLVGIILVCLGLIALYIANIYGEVVNRPLYVVRKRRLRVRPSQRKEVATRE